MSKGLRGFPPFFIANCASLSQSLTATENNINSDDGCAAHVSRETVMTSRGLGNSLPEEQAIENYLKTSKLSEYMTLQQLTNIYRGDEFDRTQFLKVEAGCSSASAIEQLLNGSPIENLLWF